MIVDVYWKLNDFNYEYVNEIYVFSLYHIYVKRERENKKILLLYSFGYQQQQQQQKQQLYVNWINRINNK